MVTKSRPDLMGKPAPPETSEVVPDPAKTTPKVVPGPAKTAPKTLPVLSETRQREIIRQLDDVYHLGEAKDPSEKVTLARKLHGASGKYRETPEEHLVLLQKAMELAREGGDAALMLEMADAVGAAFDVDAAEIKAEALADFAAEATDQARIRSLVESSGAVIDENLAECRYRAASDLAERVYAACTKSHGRPFRKQAYDRRTRVQEVCKAWEQCQAALNALQGNPDDPAANATAGRWYAIRQGDWDRGLPCLAKAGDGPLTLAADADLNSPPKDPKEQAERGDTWWDLGQSGMGEERDALLLRAGHWYRQAQPGVVSALLKDKIAQRLEAIAKIEPPVAARGGAKPASEPLDVAVQPPAKPAGAAEGALPGGLALVTRPASIPGVRWWTIETSAHRGEVRALAFNPKGDVLATAGRDGVIRLWDTTGGRLTKALIGHEKEITCVAWSPDGKLLASGSKDVTIRVWNVQSGMSVHVLADRTEEVCWVAWSPDGKTIVSTGREEGLHFWDAQLGEMTRKLEGSVTGNHYRVAFSPDGKTLASAGNDRAVRLWDAASGEKVREMVMGEGPGWGCVLWTRDGKTLVSYRTGVIYNWDPADGKLRQKFGSEIGHGILSPDGKTIMAAGWGPNTKMQVFDVNSGKLLSEQE